MQLPEIHKEYALQAKTHEQFEQKYAGKVFYIFSINNVGKKEIANTEIIDSIKQEINRLNNM
ncbi:MAG: hypothetical protein LBQ47_02580 [Endomicrobium sp.]|nr:hypothetical protein [Endomicrobium sp.]